MRITGTIIEVNTGSEGATITQAALAGDTVLYIDDGSSFLETGGTALIPETGETITYASYDYYDEEQDTLTLVTPLVTALDESTFVQFMPEAVVKTATVINPDDFEEDIQARVPHNLFALIPDGIRDDTTGYESVAIDDDGYDWVVSEIYGKSAQIVFSSMNTSPSALSDGEAPTASPVPLLEQFAVGGLRWSVTPEPNVDPVRFKIYADWVDPPTIDSDHLVADSASFSGSFSAIGGVKLSSVPPDPALSPSAVYAACVEYDVDGDGPVSGTSLAGVARRAAVEEISANWVYAGQIEADQIKSGQLDALVRLGVGDFIEMSAEESSITIYADADHQLPLVQLRPDGSVFRGRVEADDISVLVGLILQGLDSHVAQSAGITLDSSVIDPSTAPTLSSTPMISNLASAGTGYTTKGLAWDGTQYLKLIKESGSGTVCKVQKISASTGNVVGSPITLGSTSSILDASGITAIGSNWYITVKWSDYEYGGSFWRIFKYNTSGTRIAVGDLIFCDESTPVVGNDGTDLLFVYDEGALTVQKYNTSLVFQTYWSGESDFLDSTDFKYVGLGNFDFGASRIVVSTAGTAAVFSYAGNDLTEDANKWFPLVPTNSVGFTWNDSTSAFYSGRSSLYRYNSYYPAVSEKAYVAHADADTGSVKHTKISPISSVPLVKRQYIQATLAPSPAGAITPRVYMGLATSTPANTGMLRRSETIAGRNVLLDPSTAGGVALQRTLTATFKERTGFTATITTSVAHNFEVNDIVTVALSGADAAFDGTYTILSTPTSTTFTYSSPTSGTIGSTATGGTVSIIDRNTFGGGTPAWIKSQTGGLELYGDGSVVVETYPVTGAWTSYTPAWTAATTNPTAANHTITGKYKRIGKTVHFKIEIVAGSSGYGSGAYSVSLPFTAINTRLVHNGSLRTNITTPLFAEQTSTTACLLRVLPTTAGGGYTSMAQGTPVTLTSGDTIVVSGTYEAA